jgi:hypothetical protein
MSQPSQPPRRGVPILVLVAFPLALVIFAIAFAATRPQPLASTPPPAQAAVPHFVDLKAPGAPRTVVIGGATDTLPGTSNEAGYLMTNLRVGQIPAGATTATVLSDSNCTPDADGVSHCLNDLKIGGVVVTVQHHHQMANVPCLSPGETVTLMSLADYQRQL